MFNLGRMLPASPLMIKVSMFRSFSSTRQLRSNEVASSDEEAELRRRIQEDLQKILDGQEEEDKPKEISIGDTPMVQNALHNQYIANLQEKRYLELKKREKEEAARKKSGENHSEAVFEPLQNIPANKFDVTKEEIEQALNIKKSWPSKRQINKDRERDLFLAARDAPHLLQPSDEIVNKLDELLRYSKAGSRYGPVPVILVSLTFFTLYIIVIGTIGLGPLFGWVTDYDDEDEPRVKPGARIGGQWSGAQHLIPPTPVKPKTLVIDPNIICRPVWNDKIGWRVIMRPGFSYFKAMVGPRFEVVLFAAGAWGTHDRLYREIDSTKQFIQYRVYLEGVYTASNGKFKDFRSLNRPAEHMIILDSDPVQCDSVPRNCIVIPPWDGKNDRVLLDLADLLQDAYTSGNCEAFVCHMKGLPWKSGNTKFMYDLSPAIVNRLWNWREWEKTKNRQLIEGVDYPAASDRYQPPQPQPEEASTINLKD